MEIKQHSNRHQNKAILFGKFTVKVRLENYVGKIGKTRNLGTRNRMRDICCKLSRTMAALTMGLFGTDDGIVVSLMFNAELTFNATTHFAKLCSLGMVLWWWCDSSLLGAYIFPCACVSRCVGVCDW